VSLTEEFLVSKARQISKELGEPDWLREVRERSARLFFKLDMPEHARHVKVDFESLEYFSPAEKAEKLEELPQEIRETLEALGIPEEEMEMLAGMQVQVDSSIVYQTFSDQLRSLGVIAMPIDRAIREHEDLVRSYFARLAGPEENKILALHYALWAGGTFIYVPEGVEVPFPISALFVMRSLPIAQADHTIVVAEEGAKVHYIEGCSAPSYIREALHYGVTEVWAYPGAEVRITTMQNWANHVINLPTKRGVAMSRAKIEWVESLMGSKHTAVRPVIHLRGEGSSARNVGLSFVKGEERHDAGVVIRHLAPNTKSQVISKSVAKDRGSTNFYGKVEIVQGAKGSSGFVQCDSLLLSPEASSETIPALRSDEIDSELGHEAYVGKVAEDKLFYLMSRGLSEEEAITMIVLGFFEPVVRDIPFEYANEIKKLIELSIKGM